MKSSWFSWLEQFPKFTSAITYTGTITSSCLGAVKVSYHGQVWVWSTSLWWLFYFYFYLGTAGFSPNYASILGSFYMHTIMQWQGKALNLSSVLLALVACRQVLAHVIVWWEESHGLLQRQTHWKDADLQRKATESNLPRGWPSHIEQLQPTADVDCWLSNW